MFTGTGVNDTLQLCTALKSGAVNMYDSCTKCRTLTPETEVCALMSHRKCFSHVSQLSVSCRHAEKDTLLFYSISIIKNRYTDRALAAVAALLTCCVDMVI